MKIIPPASWKPEFMFPHHDKKVNTRKQVLQNLYKAKTFEQNSESFTPEEYEDFALNFEENYKCKNPFQFTDKNV